MVLKKVKASVLFIPKISILTLYILSRAYPL
jgi:hypothetical protein